MIANRFPARLGTRAGLYSAVALLATATLFAQNPGGMPNQQAPPSGQPTQPTLASPAAPPATATNPQAMGDQAFVTDAIEGSMAEVQLAQLAQQKSQSNDVKQFAKKMESDHSQMNQKWFEPAARQLGASEPKGPSKKDKKLIAKLEGLSGDEFDKEYITAMLKDHQEDLKKFKQESDATQDPAVKQIATQGATIISQHLELAEQVAKNHNIPVEGGKEVSSR